MLQVVEHQSTGEVVVDQTPSPSLAEGRVIVRNAYSVISVGTERTSIESAKQSLVDRARRNPDKFRQVLKDVRRDGPLATYKRVKNRLDRFTPLGYSSSGVVVDSAADRFRIGERVACAGYAYHAELVSIPENLCVKVPDTVNLDEAAFCTLGAIALQGVRQASVRIGESVVVLGLGLVGLITAEILKASGCRTIGIDIDQGTFEKARAIGCDACALANDESAGSVEAFTKGIGADAVIITASTPSNRPIESALRYARKKGRIVVVGNVGMKIPRSTFYEKELELKISTSYGPGRYDKLYEEFGQDYPIAYVRWTENRNMQAIMDLLSQGKLNFRELITHSYLIEDAAEAYELITGKNKEKPLGVLIKYRDSERSLPAAESRIPLDLARTAPLISHFDKEKMPIGFIGLGDFASAHLVPALRRLRAEMVGVATSTSVSSMDAARRFGFRYATCDAEEILNDDRIGTVVIATRHDSHSDYVVKALKAGKNVFVEKPVAVNREQLKTIRDTLVSLDGDRRPHLTVGFNRRFSRPIADLKELMKGRMEPLAILYRVNTGFVSKIHWSQDATQGGRIIGEACHFIDVMRFLTGSKIVDVNAISIQTGNWQVQARDTSTVTVSFQDGSLGTLLYLGNGDTSLPKEYCEAYWQGRVAVMNDFRSVIFHSAGKAVKKRYDGSKGHFEEMRSFVTCITEGKPQALSFEEIEEVTETTFVIDDILTNRKRKGVDA